ncbi:MAG: hypothetical protein QS748_11635 [Candidatus Endonucleobacter bathymodioli]|uniref:Uncharacterized protein n=1 Tax=Candidatus Endonucleibacter bathymodioli TaxID=539814 RepID=A0AA90NN19_9GAMM|nr:hypothetical protein [Candidatus Endonucleobacter bathymodioli]
MKIKSFFNRLHANTASIKQATQDIFSFSLLRKVTTHPGKATRMSDPDLDIHEKNRPINSRSHKKDDTSSLHSLINKDDSHLSLSKDDDSFCIPSKHKITVDCFNDLLTCLSTVPINTDILQQYCEILLPDPTNETMINDCSRALLQALKEKASLNSSPLNLKSHTLYLEQRNTMETLSNMIVKLIKTPGMSETVERMKTILLTITNQASLCELELMKENVFDTILKENSAQDNKDNFKKSETIIKLIGDTENTERQFNADLFRGGITYNLLDKDGSTLSSIQKKDNDDIAATDANSQKKHYAKLNTTLLDQLKKFAETYPEDQSEFIYRFIVSMTAQGAYAPSTSLLFKKIHEHQSSIGNNEGLYMFQTSQKNRTFNVEIKQLDNDNIRISVSALFQIKATDAEGINDAIDEIKSVNTEMVCEYDCSPKSMLNEDRIKLQHITIQDK